MKKNTKGFTLIELLAVIVILAIIALIASPIILNIIQNSQKSARARSVEAYGHAIENTVATAMSNPEFVGGDVEVLVENGKTYACVTTKTESGAKVCSSTKEEVTYSGSKVTCKTVEYNKDGKGYTNLVGCQVAGGNDVYSYTNNPSAGDNTGKAVLSSNSNAATPDPKPETPAS